MFDVARRWLCTRAKAHVF